VTNHDRETHYDCTSVGGWSNSGGCDLGTYVSQERLANLQDHCQECHRPGEIGPFSMMSYQEVRPWAKSIRQAVVSKKMPPWHADDAHSVRMSNDRSLSKDEIEVLMAWADAGAPAGDPKDAPAPRRFPEGWTIGKPDVVFDLGTDFRVLLDGGLSGHYFFKFAVFGGSFTLSPFSTTIDCPTSEKLSRMARTFGYFAATAKSHSFHTGQCPVLKYNRQLMQAILHDRVQIAKACNVNVISLGKAPQGYQDFDNGAAKKFVIDPHGSTMKAVA
jgi:hypothetical protein